MRASLDKPFYLAYNLITVSGTQVSAYNRNRTERTAVIAALGYLYIGTALKRKQSGPVTAANTFLRRAQHRAAAIKQLFYNAVNL